jgi:hypothetical protein
MAASVARRVMPTAWNWSSISPFSPSYTMRLQVHVAIALAVEEHVPAGIEEFHGALDLGERDGAPRDAGEPPLDLADALVELGEPFRGQAALPDAPGALTGAVCRAVDAAGTGGPAQNIGIQGNVPRPAGRTLW